MQPYIQLKKWNQKKMKECDKRKSHTSSKFNMIYISSIRPSLHFNALHPTTFHSPLLHLSTLSFLSFKLHPTTLHSPLLHLSTLPFLSFKLHPTTLHSPLLHLSTLPFLSFKLHPNTLHCPLMWLKPI